ncbi:MAG: beta-N-acetylhexosaminidase [Clostridium chrysemydis]|uniref:beta-N-acetylhexosaminidase n=1 Tax=Clostridium chrysemydis TaxID=2665504 RepID=UPI003F4074F6
MYLIPKPKSYKEFKGNFKIRRGMDIVISSNSSFEELDSAILLQKEILERFGFKLNIRKSFKEFENSIALIRDDSLKDESYKLTVEEEKIKIIGKGGSGVFYGVQTLIQLIRRDGVFLKCLEILDEPYFKNRGYFHDVTRGKVPKLKTLKELIDKAAFYKINQIQLYIEHSFAFKGMSEVWLNKDPITPEEILLLDSYARKRHVELVPALATFGHLYEVLRTKTYEKLCELENKNIDEFSFFERMAHHTLNVSNEESIKLVKNMIEEFIPLFTSEKFNICCDETFDLGKGRSKDLASKSEEGRLYVDFLNKVIDIVKKHNKKVLFWGDVIVNHKELLSEIPEDVVCLNWNYSKDATEDSTKVIAESNRELYLCPGVCGWNKLMNLIDNSLENIYKMVSYAKKYKGIGILNTDWGDFGHINLFANSIVGLAYGGSLSWNPNVDREFNKFYEEISLIEFGDKTKTLVKLLETLSKCQKVSFEEIVRFKEFNNEIVNIDIEFLKEDFKNSKLIGEKIQDLALEVSSKRDMQEFIISSRGVVLINEFFINIKEDSSDKKELALKLEEWFYDYMRVWRDRNKESELYRLREVIEYLCSYLRSDN